MLSISFLINFNKSWFYMKGLFSLLWYVPRYWVYIFTLTKIWSKDPCALQRRALSHRRNWLALHSCWSSLGWKPKISLVRLLWTTWCCHSCGKRAIGLSGVHYKFIAGGDIKVTCTIMLGITCPKKGNTWRTCIYPIHMSITRVPIFEPSKAFPHPFEEW